MVGNASRATTLVPAPGVPDTDGDGIPDDQEAAVAAAIASGALEDEDGDGVVHCSFALLAPQNCVC